MGIAGLHGLLKSIQKPCNLKKFSGQTIGVDAYGWLHRGIIACATDLALGKPTTKHVDYALNRVRMLLYFGVTPYLVFDGDNLPSKAGTEAARATRREESKRIGMELDRLGKTAQAYQEFQKAIDVTPYMARQLIEELKKMDVQYVVAPYEADAQLAYLEQQGIVNGIISEDSDMLVFGVKRLLSKLDQHGDCIEINRADFSSCRDISLIGWSDADFRHMCILSGCDYLPSIPKMGLKTAYRHIRKYKSVERIVKMLQFDGQHRVPPTYLQDFRQAELTFLHHRVFSPKAGQLAMLNPVASDVKEPEMPFLGPSVDPETATGVACGDLDPMTKEPINLKPSDIGRPMPSLIRRQTLGSSADLKPKKPITSFFTPRRTPLAELDPNSLTPSPSQQRILERNANASWMSTPTPSVPQVTRSASSAPAHRPSPRPSPMVRTEERTSFLARASQVSSFQPTKRQRLCSETDEESLPPAFKESRSRFFSGGTQDSPMDQKKSRSKKPRDSSFGVFSDEVVEDIMTQLPDMIEPAKPRKVKVFADAESVNTASLSNHHSGSPKISELSSSSNDYAESQTTLATETSTISTDETASQKTGATSFETTLDPESRGQTVREESHGPNSSFMAKFAYQGQKEKQDSDSQHVQKSRSIPQPAHKNEGALVSSVRRTGSVRSGNANANPRTGLSTPLQRLGQGALSRSRSMDGLARGTADTQNRCGEALSRVPNIERSRTMNSLAASSVTNGSEDMIIPASDEDEEIPSPEAPRRVSTLYLKRFAFTPK